MQVSLGRLLKDILAILRLILGRLHWRLLGVGCIHPNLLVERILILRVFCIAIRVLLNGIILN